MQAQLLAHEEAAFWEADCVQECIHNPQAQTARCHGDRDEGRWMGVTGRQ